MISLKTPSKPLPELGNFGQNDLAGIVYVQLSEQIHHPGPLYGWVNSDCSGGSKFVEFINPYPSNFFSCFVLVWFLVKHVFPSSPVF